MRCAGSIGSLYGSGQKPCRIPWVRQRRSPAAAAAAMPSVGASRGVPRRYSEIPGPKTGDFSYPAEARRLQGSKSTTICWYLSDRDMGICRNSKSIKVSVLHRNPLLKKPFMEENGAFQDPLSLGFFIHGQQDLQIVGVAEIGMVAVSTFYDVQLFGSNSNRSSEPSFICTESNWLCWQ